MAMEIESLLIPKELDEGIKKAQKVFKSASPAGLKINRSSVIRMLIIKGLEALEIKVKKDA